MGRDLGFPMYLVVVGCVATGRPGLKSPLCHEALQHWCLDYNGIKINNPPWILHPYMQKDLCEITLGYVLKNLHFFKYATLHKASPCENNPAKECERTTTV